MGLTRAWIGAGAKAVIATGWDVPDTAAQSLMTDFYLALRSSPGTGRRGGAAPGAVEGDRARRRRGAVGRVFPLSRIP